MLESRGVGKQECLFCILPVCCFMLYTSEMLEQRGRTQHESCLNPPSGLNFCSWVSQMSKTLTHYQGWSLHFKGILDQCFSLLQQYPLLLTGVSALSHFRVEIELPVGPFCVHVGSASCVCGAAPAAQRPPAEPGTILSPSGMTPCAATCQMFPPLCLSFVTVNDVFGLCLYFLCVLRASVCAHLSLATKFHWPQPAEFSLLFNSLYLFLSSFCNINVVKLYCMNWMGFLFFHVFCTFLLS